MEREENLSFEDADDAWIFDDAVSAGNARVDKDARLRDRAVVRDGAYVSYGAVLSGHAVAEDAAYVRGAVMRDCARVSGNGMILNDGNPGDLSPVLYGNCSVYGKVRGNIRIGGNILILSGEDYRNDSRDTFVIDERGRSVLRDLSRDALAPTPPEDERDGETPETPVKPVRKRRGRSR